MNPSGNAPYAMLLKPLRRSASTIGRTRPGDAASDRSRVIYCSSFRRLQQKTQVFPLEPNTHVRTRLSHSLEVSDLGRTLATTVAERLVELSLLQPADAISFVTFVETACLVHDIGNPPFGHFGEVAIRQWFELKDTTVAYTAIGSNDDDANLHNRLEDFRQFDGNPQSFRIVASLHCERDEYGLNLTIPSLMSSLKYARTTSEHSGSGGTLTKKPGYFQTEVPVVAWCREQIQAASGRSYAGKRFPLAYLMEAADDIAYCLSDISDGIEKRVVTKDHFYDYLQTQWQEKCPGVAFPFILPAQGTQTPYNIEFPPHFARAVVAKCAELYCTHHAAILAGESPSLTELDAGVKTALNIIKSFAKTHIYTSPVVADREVSGYTIIRGLLDFYEPLLQLPASEFVCMIPLSLGHECRSLCDKDYEGRVLSKVGRRFMQVYRTRVLDAQGSLKVSLVDEWWHRAHMIVDHVSGMTDNYALDTYRLCKGIRL